MEKITTIDAYNLTQSDEDRAICDALRELIDQHLSDAQSKIWHAHPVWFLDGNPIVGYSKLKGPVRIMFWSGQSFQTPGLHPEGTFKAAEARYTVLPQIDPQRIAQWLIEARTVQWDYKNIVKNKGRLDSLL